MSDKSKLKHDFAALYEDELLKQITYLSEKAGNTSSVAVPNILDKFADPQYTHQRISGMRVDRQIRAFPRYFWTRFRKKFSPKKVTAVEPLPSQPQPKILNPDITIICPVYPGGRRLYGGEFIERRALSYVAQGASVSIIELSPKQNTHTVETRDGIDVIRCGLTYAETYLQDFPPKQIGVHQIERPVWDLIKGKAGITPITVWVHGFEARDWKELAFNYTDDELEDLQEILDKVTVERRDTIKEIMADVRIRKIFVSSYMKQTAEDFSATDATNAHVIHNQILHTEFPYIAKPAAQRFKVLWVRSFAAHNYANDLSRDAILELSKRDVFSNFDFTIFGDGKHFESSTIPLEKFDNITINQRFVSTSEMSALHKTHGIMLVPSRWDSQGLTCGEAMASGLVPITNNVAALPEFMDEQCGFLCIPDSPVAIADALEFCATHPEAFLEMSEKAAQRAAKQCGKEATIDQEIDLLNLQAHRQGD